MEACTGARALQRSEVEGMANIVLAHVSEHSVLEETGARNLIPFVVAGRKRYATCSGVAWFCGNHLAVVNLYGGYLRIYRFEEGDGGTPARLVLLHEIHEGLSFPEDVAVTPDGSMIAIAHSISDRHGISLHPVDAASLAPRPSNRMLRVGSAFHGLNFSRNSRHLAFTELGTPGYVEVVRVDTGACTSRLENLYAPLKPKGVSFTHDERFIVLTLAPNVCQEGAETSSSGMLAVHRFDAALGIIAPEPAALLHSAGGMLDTVETNTILPAAPGRPWRILAANQGADTVPAFDFDPEAGTLAFAGIFAAGLSFPHGIDASADGRFVAIASYGDDTLRIARLTHDEMSGSTDVIADNFHLPRMR
jgi:hypothetical protein